MLDRQEVVLDRQEAVLNQAEAPVHDQLLPEPHDCGNQLHEIRAQLDRMQGSVVTQDQHVEAIRLTQGDEFDIVRGRMRGMQHQLEDMREHVDELREDSGGMDRFKARVQDQINELDRRQDLFQDQMDKMERRQGRLLDQIHRIMHGQQAAPSQRSQSDASQADDHDEHGQDGNGANRSGNEFLLRPWLVDDNDAQPTDEDIDDAEASVSEGDSEVL